MGEAFFILKCFVLSTLIVFCLQFKTNNTTFEYRFTQSLRNTPAHRWLADMGLGAVNFSREMYAQALGHPRPVRLSATSSYPEQPIEAEARDVASQTISLNKTIAKKEAKKFKEMDAIAEGHNQPMAKESNLVPKSQDQ